MKYFSHWLTRHMAGDDCVVDMMVKVVREDQKEYSRVKEIFCPGDQKSVV